VHPQKSEVRFRDGSVIHSIVLRSVREALRSADLTPAYTAMAAAQRAGNVNGYAGVMGEAQREMDVGGGGVTLPPDMPGSGFGPAVSENIAPADGPAAIRNFVEYLRAPGAAQAKVTYDGLRSAVEGDAQAQPGGEPGALVDNRPKSRVLQVHNSYLVTQDESGVVIIDQHALHERVMFEYLLTRVFGDSAPGLESQRLLAPAMVPATSAQIDSLPALSPLLVKAGIDADQSGPGMIAVHAFPNFLFDRGGRPHRVRKRPLGDGLSRGFSSRFAAWGRAVDAKSAGHDVVQSRRESGRQDERHRTGRARAITVGSRAVEQLPPRQAHEHPTYDPRTRKVIRANVTGSINTPGQRSRAQPSAALRLSRARHTGPFPDRPACARRGPPA
jgi:hypothetical protein